MVYKFSIVMILALISACSSSIDSVSNYNEKLFAYEEKLNECNKLEGDVIKGVRLTEVSDKTIRVALSYFYIKNSLDCTSKESEDLASSVASLIDDQSVAEYIKINARDLQGTISFQAKQLIEPEKHFNSLSDSDKKLLNSMGVSNRPFSPSAALEYYIDK